MTEEEEIDNVHCETEDNDDDDTIRSFLKQIIFIMRLMMMIIISQLPEIDNLYYKTDYDDVDHFLAS